VPANGGLDHAVDLVSLATQPGQRSRGDQRVAASSLLALDRPGGGPAEK
jgi:hypothetical protein